MKILAHTLLYIFIFSAYASPIHSQESVTIWTLKNSWWEKLTTEPKGQERQPLIIFLEETEKLVGQINPENNELAQLTSKRLKKNISLYLDLTETSGWKIEESPKVGEEISIKEFLQAAQEKRNLLAQVADLSKEIGSLEIIFNNLEKEVSEYQLNYSKQLSKSLEQLLAGLDLLVVKTQEAIVNERIRILKENQQTIQQQVNWQTDIIARATDSISIKELDVALITNQEKLASQQIKELDKEVIETSAWISPQDNGGRVESINTIQAQVLKLQATLAQLLLKLQLTLLNLEGNHTDSSPIDTIIFNTESSSDQLYMYEKHAQDWLIMIRKEQDLAEKAFILEREKKETPDSKLQDTLLSYNVQKSAQDTLSILWQLETQIYQAQALNHLIQQRAIKKLGFISGFSQKIGLFIFDLKESISQIFSYPLFHVNQTPVSAWKILYALFVFFAAYASSIGLKQTLKKIVKQKQHISPASMYTFTRVTHYCILFLGFLLSLSTIGIDFSNLLLITGALSVGIGFGLQGIVNNFLGGLIVLFDRKIRIGDFIELSTGEKGRIAEVNVQNTLIRTSTGHDILVPNSQMISNQLTNWTLRDQYARLHIPFSVAYGTDKKKVREVIIAAALKVPETVSDHKSLSDPNVWLVQFGESSLDFELVVWVDFRRSKKREASLRSAFLWQIEEALIKASIEIPFPQREVTIKNKNYK